MWNVTGNHRCHRVLVWMFGLILCSATSLAHPMGNFSINHYSKVKIGKEWVEIRYLIDMAEIPTFQEMRQFDIGPTGDKANNSRYLDQENKLFKDAIALESDGRSVVLETVSRQITFADGAGGLPTMKIGFVFRGKVHSGEDAHKLNYADDNFPGRAGWKEIVVLGDGVTIRENSASGIDRSQELTNYSSDVLNSPPQQLSAQVGYGFVRPIFRKMITAQRKAVPQTPITSPVTPRPLASNTPRSRFTQLISTQSNLSFWVLLSAAFIAAGLGALPALEPGHGKTIVAAYLCGSAGTPRAACLRGLGITGGIVPCPAALVVLLSAFSLHRIGFGLFLITAFSLGLAAVLVIVGLTMVYTKRFMASRIGSERTILRYLPLLSSAFMVVLGVGIAVSAFAAAPIGRRLLSKDKLVPFVTVTLLGLFLGMRHSTDADHVVAVSTIVSRQQSIKSSATIGLLWGLGHTLTIFLVGSAIIIFGVVIPPRLGLSMEFCVALMLILLGLLNLTGVMRWITERLNAMKSVSASPSASLDHVCSGSGTANPGSAKQRMSGW